MVDRIDGPTDEELIDIEQEAAEDTYEGIDQDVADELLDYDYDITGDHWIDVRVDGETVDVFCFITEEDARELWDVGPDFLIQRFGYPEADGFRLKDYNRTTLEDYDFEGNQWQHRKL